MDRHGTSERESLQQEWQVVSHLWPCRSLQWKWEGGEPAGRGCRFDEADCCEKEEGDRAGNSGMKKVVGGVPRQLFGMAVEEDNVKERKDKDKAEAVNDEA